MSRMTWGMPFLAFLDGFGDSLWGLSVPLLALFTSLGGRRTMYSYFPQNGPGEGESNLTPRAIRMEYPNAVYHVTARGNLSAAMG